jgi:hypothetical protein
MKFYLKGAIMKRVKINSIVILLLCSIVWTPICMAGYRGNNPNISVEHQKILSTIKYTGDGQFKHQVETLLTIEKEPLSGERTKYSISSQDFSFSQTNDDQQPSSNYITFIVDGKSGRIADSDENLTLLEKVNNNCLSSLTQVTKQNIGKTWKQSFDLSSFDHSLPNNLTFTMTAINVNTNQYGRLTAVRALSEPFVVSVLNKEGKVKEIKSRMRAAYLFDSEINEIYLSMSVFEAATDINSKNEKLLHEVATYKTDANGVAVDLDGLGKDFEGFVRKVGLTSHDLKIEKETRLPQWAQSEGLRADQMSNICAAATCEGALNPVTTITIPAARIAALQSAGNIASAQQITTISAVLAKDVPALGGMKIAVSPAWAGYKLLTAGNVTALAGATAGGIAIVENNTDDSSSARSPIVP